MKQLLAVSLLLSTAAVAHAQAPQYSVQILPQLQTPTGPIPVGGYAMNDHGWVVGVFYRAQPNDPYATAVALYRPGIGWEDLGYPGSLRAMSVTDINNDGLIIGQASPTSISLNSNAYTWTWQNGQFTIYPQLVANRPTLPGLTNNAGRLIGYANDGSFNTYKAVEFVNGATTLLLPPSVPGGSTALDVNNHGVILGTELLGAFLWAPGQPRWYFPPPSSVPIVEFNAINDHNDAVGMARATGHTETRSAVVWLDGAGWTVLPRPSGRRYDAKRINNVREVIGTATDNTGAIGTHGWLWKPGMSLTPLEYLIPEPPNVYAVTWVSDINERSEILAGMSVRATGDGFQAILKPIIAEPLRLDLASKVPPGLHPPGVPLQVNLRILDGTHTYTPGTARVHYRSNPSAPFTAIALQPAGPGIYSALLPPASCGDSPQFYFSAEADGGGIVHLPAGAPASLFSTQVGAWITTHPIDESFESGVLPPGWSATGLWNVNSTCFQGGTGFCYDGGTWSAYYGIPSQCNFNTGGVNSGILTAPAVTLPAIAPGGEIRLVYCSGRGLDSVNNSATLEVLANGVVVDTLPNWNPNWDRRTVNLAAYAGQTVVLEWRFSTGIFGTSSRGWNVDNVRLHVRTTGCTNEVCYANCDQSTVAPVLNVADFTCFLQKFAAGDPYANCDGSTVPPVLNVADFTCFLQKFAAGCP